MEQSFRPRFAYSRAYISSAILCCGLLRGPYDTMDVKATNTSWHIKHPTNTGMASAWQTGMLSLLLAPWSYGSRGKCAWWEGVPSRRLTYYQPIVRFLHLSLGDFSSESSEIEKTDPNCLITRCSSWFCPKHTASVTIRNWIGKLLFEIFVSDWENNKELYKGHHVLITQDEYTLAILVPNHFLKYNYR